MGLIRLLISAPQIFLLATVPLLYSVIAHEVAHGVCARAFGDETARRAGRLTLNPLPHLDPMGLLMLLFVGFGWARPVPVSYGQLRPLRPGIFCVALAGCATNIVIATLALAALQAQLVSSGSASAVVLGVVARINIALGAFNLIPIPPLDGSRILLSLLPPEGQRALLGLERYGFIILILLLVSGLLDPVIRAAESVILMLIGLLFTMAR
jgi:Zn-dependent protease